jgi:hypothetical protein
MKKWKIIVIVISAIAVGAIACLISASYAYREGMRASGFSMSSAELWLAGQHMSNQMTAANCEGVKKSINDHLTVMEKYKNSNNILFDEKTYYSDKMLDHLRLSLIENKQGNEKEKLKQLAIAKDACAHNGHFKSCSEESLILIANRFQEKNPIACLNDK